MPRARVAAVPLPVLAVVALAWTLAILAAVTGTGHLLHHHELIDAGSVNDIGHVRHHDELSLDGVQGPAAADAPPLWAAFGLFVAAWQGHIAAMMLPSSLPLVALFSRVTADLARPGAARAAFLAGYAVVWTGFGALAFAGDVVVHRVVNQWPWLAGRYWIVGGSVLALAGLFQFSSLKDRCLRECRQPSGFIVRYYRRGARAAFALGTRHGLFCLGCCWALMLVMFAVGIANPVWMAPLALLMFNEKAVPTGRRLTAPAGVALLALAALVFLHPAWLPSWILGA